MESREGGLPRSWNVPSSHQRAQLHVSALSRPGAMVRPILTRCKSVVTFPSVVIQYHDVARR